MGDESCDDVFLKIFNTLVGVESNTNIYIKREHYILFRRVMFKLGYYKEPEDLFKRRYNYFSARPFIVLDNNDILYYDCCNWCGSFVPPDNDLTCVMCGKKVDYDELQIL